ncbi:type VI immunity family protein [Burkholderia gladioli]|uniref:type VI immunity family protein n=1 Tax=Burkholderia gladioli TaxID=28095 RepID=UPI0016409D3F|nr:type VI immunity family protein [Burkholderia gladioli]
MNHDHEQQLQQLAQAGMMPNAIFEPRYPHNGIGAALVVRAAIYFKGGYTRDKRDALAWVFDRYVTVARPAATSRTEQPLKWMWFNGKRALPIAKAPALASLASSVGANEGFDATFVGGDTAREASFYEFTTFCIEQFQADIGTRGLDVLVFTLPVPAVRANPEPFVQLFRDAAAAVDAIHGHAGLAVNLSPPGRVENESSEYFMAQMLGPGIDVGNPISMKVRDLTDRLKTVDWLTLIDRAMLGKVGGISTLQSELPKDWYDLKPCAQGLLNRAGVAPDAGVERDTAPSAPPAYVVVNAALRPVIAETVSILQRGTVNGDAPVYNSVASSDAWLRRYDVSADELLAAKAAVLDTPKLPPTGA